jgi:hypothetical protein
MEILKAKKATIPIVTVPTKKRRERKGTSDEVISESESESSDEEPGPSTKKGKSRRETK